MKYLCALILWCWSGLALAEEILIGQTADFSSVAGEQMKDFHAGVMAYLNPINQAGGIRGRKVKLIRLDDALSADLASENAQELIHEQKVVALFATRGTDPTEAVVKVAEKANMPIIAPVTGAEAVHQSPVVFPVRASYHREIDAMLHHMSFVPTRLAVLVQKDKFGQPLIQYLEERVAQRYQNISLVNKVMFERKNTELKLHAHKILASNPNAVIALCNPTTCEAFMTEVYQQTKASHKVRPPIYQTSISDSYAQFKKLGANVVEGHPFTQVLPDPYGILSPLGKEYRLAMAGTGAPINYRTFEGYVSAKVLVMALGRAAVLSPAGVTEALERMGAVDLGGFVIRYAPHDHQGSRFVELVTLDRSGKLVH